MKKLNTNVTYRHIFIFICILIGLYLCNILYRGIAKNVWSKAVNSVSCSLSSKHQFYESSKEAFALYVKENPNSSWSFANCYIDDIENPYENIWVIKR